ncbi:type II toxin-antitoxin system RelE/ParE family toxin [Prochlorothrix hollandica]|uniref:Transposase n=1 Tax=Prochlorothrix hollandica PCC 9006 = CALU 1027 TaxID=317619 RepID=A0A0M2Q1X9_PROHO|nr:type II toxin-antitoxin system RelE/ParE family toxin [Prochlorothrix hollandica]KKJ01303.1 transposase [Prochlorothrix hollandica PCC 9006 = CALU 1027]
MTQISKVVVWLRGEVKTPPFSSKARVEMGVLLRCLQQGEQIRLPCSRPMPSIGLRCHELRVQDEDKIWRLVYRIDRDAIVILEVFQKTTQKTPQQVIRACQQRLKQYDS